MRVNALILLAAIGLVVGFADPAAAEKVKTNQTTKLYARAGEQSKVIVTVKEGQNMTLLAQDGRWLKVRVKGRTGYVPRSKVDLPDDGDIARNTRRRPFVDGRSKHRGFGSEEGPDDRIGADAVGEGQDDEDDSGSDDEEDEPKKVTKKPVRSNDDEDDEEDEEDETPKKPVKASRSSGDDEDEAGDDDGGGDDEEADSGDDEGSGDEEDEGDERPTVRVSKKVAVLDKPKSKSDVAFMARPDDKLFAIEEKGDWTFVENEDADGGWIKTSDLDSGGSGGGGGGPGKRIINVGAQVGLMFIQQGLRSAGSTNTSVPDNYNIGTSSVTIALGGGILFPYGKKYLLGGELTWQYSKTLFGGVFYDPDGAAMPMPGVDIGVTVSNVNARFTPGIDFKKKNGMTLFGHLGYRYQGFLIKDVESMAANPAKLPSEVLKGPTIGAALVIPKLTDKIGMKVGVDAMIVGASVTQTKGLEDGASPSAKAATICAGIVYRWKPKMDLQANYDLNYTKADFGAPLASSQRGHMGSSVSRTDIFHMVTFGVAMPF